MNYIGKELSLSLDDIQNTMDEAATNRFLEKNFDMSLEELKKFIKKYEPERLI
jgi:hypothetical protein